MINTSQTVTIGDVAKAAGTSISTVSRVLSGSNYPVSAVKRERVLSAAKELGYEPNMLGRILKTDVNPSIGIIIPSFQNPFYTQLIIGIEKEAIENNYFPLVFSSQRSPETERNLINHLIKNRIKGLMISSIDDSAEAVERFVSTGGKVCIFESNYSDHDKVINAKTNVLEASRKATEYLISQGHRAIAFLSTPFNRESRIMTLDGYKLALADCNLPFSEKDVMTVPYEFEAASDLYELEAGRKLAHKFMMADGHKNYTAIVAINDLIAYGIIHGLQEAGIRIPEDVSIISFDNIPYSGYINPPLTTMDMPARLLGQRACHMVVESLNSNASHNGITLSVNAELVVRKSVKAI
ncbi:MAG: LacI family transcriptional regulator [Clostridium sp.]|nr:LacI family transcriptional regulator [Clostridium sp.]